MPAQAACNEEQAQEGGSPCPLGGCLRMLEKRSALRTRQRPAHLSTVLSQKAHFKSRGCGGKDSCQGPDGWMVFPAPSP